MSEAVQHLDRSGRPRLAYRHTPGTGPTIVFLPGYMSDMAGGKATALFDWAASEGHACLLLDYAGCGLSDGLFADQTLLDWRGDVLDVIDAAAEGRLVDEGDPIELPVIPLSIPNATLGFWEEKDGLAWWSEIGESWGFATLADIPGSIGTMAVADFLDPQRRSIRRPHWGPGVPQHPGRVDAVWMVMPKLVVAKAAMSNFDTVDRRARST